MCLLDGRDLSTNTTFIRLLAKGNLSSEELASDESKSQSWLCIWWTNWDFDYMQLFFPQSSWIINSRMYTMYIDFKIHCNRK